MSTVISTTKDKADEAVFLDRSGLYTTLSAVIEYSSKNNPNPLILASDIAVKDKKGKITYSVPTKADKLSQLTKHNYLIRVSTDDPTGEKAWVYGYMLNTPENVEWMEEYKAERTREMKRAHDAKRVRPTKSSTAPTIDHETRIKNLESIVQSLCQEFGLVPGSASAIRAGN